MSTDESNANTLYWHRQLSSKWFLGSPEMQCYEFAEKRGKPFFDMIDFYPCWKSWPINVKLEWFFADLEQRILAWNMSLKTPLLT